MDILSDVNVVGKIYSSSLITGYICANSNGSCGGYVRIENGNISASGCGSSIDNLIASSLRSKNWEFEITTDESRFCKQAYFYQGIFGYRNGYVEMDSCGYEHPDYYVQKHIEEMTIPTNCGRFFIFCGCQNENTFPIIQAVDSVTGKVINMNYEFCFCKLENKTIVIGEKSTGTSVSNFTFNLLLT